MAFRHGHHSSSQHAEADVHMLQYGERQAPENGVRSVVSVCGVLLRLMMRTAFGKNILVFRPSRQDLPLRPSHLYGSSPAN